MDERHVGLIGATSLVGVCLRQSLLQHGWKVSVFSRKPVADNHAQTVWRSLNDIQTNTAATEKIAQWICVAPVWTLPEHFNLLKSYGIKRIVALSSTSCMTKKESPDSHEQKIAQQLTAGENQLSAWAESNQIEWVILRPTLIYGLGRDKNITEIARFIRCFGFFPLFGRAEGLRQPIHGRDVAKACFYALKTLKIKNCTYNLSGGETLAYREMVRRIFLALDKKSHLITIPLWFFRLTVQIIRIVPRYRHWNSAMAQRMNQDMVFDSTTLQQQLQFSSGPFILSPEDLP